MAHAEGEEHQHGPTVRLELEHEDVSPTRLRLVVGREHVWLVLAPERFGLLWRRVEQAGALAYSLSGSVGHERQLPAGPSVGHDVAAVDITAELDMRMLDHGSMMAGDRADRQAVARPLCAYLGGHADTTTTAVRGRTAVGRFRRSIPNRPAANAHAQASQGMIWRDAPGTQASARLDPIPVPSFPNSIAHHESLGGASATDFYGVRLLRCRARRRLFLLHNVAPHWADPRVTDSAQHAEDVGRVRTAILAVLAGAIAAASALVAALSPRHAGRVHRATQENEITRRAGELYAQGELEVRLAVQRVMERHCNPATIIGRMWGLTCATRIYWPST